MTDDLFNNSPPAKEDVYSVSDLNREARYLLEENFPAVVVEGELSNIAMPASGHWYFTLKDESAQVRCAMFKGRNQYVKIKPKEGMQIQLKAKLSLYEGRGDYQLIVQSVSPLGEGALRIAFEALKSRLHNEGLFNGDLKLSLPSLPKHIGVITSPTGAAIRDIISVLKRRFPSISVTILPVSVQGRDAAPGMVKAIKLANKKQGCLKDLDVLIIARGGGSLEDLWAFNDEQLARAIFESTLPVVSAVGHEVDFTIADFVADVRAATPSAAAELLSPEQEDFMAIYAAYQTQLSNMLMAKVKQFRQNLNWLKKQIKHPGRRLQEQAQKLDHLEIKMRREFHFYLSQSKNSVKELTHGLIQYSPISLIREQQQNNRYLSASLQKASLKSLKNARFKLADLSRALNNLSPLNILSRGYSMTYDVNNKLITQVASIKTGDTLRTRLHQGEVVSSVNYVRDPLNKTSTSE
ncbi:MAG: exodeoxyribonuclease VII large subunit [SAR86 cluster bacterium]|uniref:Exodeoxyribonuclease 7 large subunit n=1 Tax=SAR86 cluster bacterium TaxID=2030880 RepID=A0A2A5CBA8_9GAMM|nr:MAG: exodeoxyribonuclease VII large subunit [SAR86 cluster bacterium]